jgi:DNA repair exonuclease SbcCD ATPase subunit
MTTLQSGVVQKNSVLHQNPHHKTDRSNQKKFVAAALVCFAGMVTFAVLGKLGRPAILARQVPFFNTSITQTATAVFGLGIVGSTFGSVKGRFDSLDDEIRQLYYTRLPLEQERYEGSEQLQGGSEQLQEVSEQLQRASEQLQGASEQLQGASEQLQEENGELQGENERLQGENERLQERIRRLQEENRPLQGGKVGDLQPTE